MGIGFTRLKLKHFASSSIDFNRTTDETFSSPAVVNGGTIDDQPEPNVAEAYCAERFSLL